MTQRTSDSIMETYRHKNKMLVKDTTEILDGNSVTLLSNPSTRSKSAHITTQGSDTQLLYVSWKAWTNSENGSLNRWNVQKRVRWWNVFSRFGLGCCNLYESCFIWNNKSLWIYDTKTCALYYLKSQANFFFDFCFE